jgi:hypothetical protein
MRVESCFVSGGIFSPLPPAELLANSRLLRSSVLNLDTPDMVLGTNRHPP